MTDIDETDAVITDSETGKKRFKTTTIEIRPLKNKKIEFIWALTATTSLTGLTIGLIHLSTI